MYQIILPSGRDLAVVEAPYYIRHGKSGSLCPASAQDAIGVAVNGTPYNLAGHNDIEGAETVIVRQVDGGVYILQEQKTAANLDYIAMMTDIELPEEETDAQQAL